jgi:hypothetical protein
VFASPAAVSSAMSAIRPGVEQVVFGKWLRRTKAGSKLCCPALAKGLFNHQAVIYSRSIHAWHGDYVNLRGLTTADYLFFATLFSTASVASRVVDTTLAVIDVSGMSAGVQTLSQKYAIDYLCGRTSRFKLISVLALHPLYSSLKQLFRPRS